MSKAGITFLVQLFVDAPAGCREDRGLLDWPLLASDLGDMACHSESAHVPLCHHHTLVVEEVVNALEVPTSGRPRVFMQEVSSLTELVTVKCAAEFNVSYSNRLFLFELLHPLGVLPVHRNVKLLQQ